MAVMNINSKKLKAMIENGKTFLVDFWAPWCPHCRKINPAYEQIAEQYAGVLDVVKVDMDENDKLWSELQVELIPTLRLYVDGKPVASTVAPESKAAIDEFLSGILPEHKKEDDAHVYDMLIIGGGPGGYTAALYAARAGFDKGGYIVAGENTATNIPGVYAVGDVRTKLLRQVVTAVADGAMAVHMAEEFLAGGA